MKTCLRVCAVLAASVLRMSATSAPSCGIAYPWLRLLGRSEYDVTMSGPGIGIGWHFQ
jgi:hypothetical protein